MLGKAAPTIYYMLMAAFVLFCVSAVTVPPRPAPPGNGTLSTVLQTTQIQTPLQNGEDLINASPAPKAP